MNHRKIPLVASVALAFASSLPAQYIEDRDNRNPTPAIWSYNLSAASLASLVSKGNRIVDLEVTRVSPSLLFTVSLVPNSGTFRKTWWYYYNVKAAGVSSLVTKLKARLTDIEVYNTTTGVRFAVLLEANSTNGKGWWWVVNASVASISSLASNNGARVVDLEQYTIGSKTYHAAVLLKNSGADAKTWWWYLNVTKSTVNSLLTTNKARIWDLERLSNGRYNVVMVKFSGEYEWHLYGQTSAQVDYALAQYGARIIDVEQYTTLLGARFDVVLANASNAASSRARDVMHGYGSGGTMGVYLRRIPLLGSGYDLAFINGLMRYEPASTLKTLHHVTTMRDVYSSSSMYLGKPMSVKYKTTATSSCPVSTTPYTLSLRRVLEGMMRNSDNALTKVITDFYGMSGLNTSAAAIGMKNTKIQRHMGCGPLTNYSTLVDLGILHERVIKGYLGSQRRNFYDIMLGGFYGGFMKAMIDQEAAKVGLGTTQLNFFVANMEVRGKGGNDTWGNPARHNRSWYGYVKLPVWANGGMSSREYAAGAFVNTAVDDAKAAKAVSAGSAEVLRDEVNACMKTLKSHTFGSFVPFGSSCGGKFSPYVHTAAGTPELGQRISYRANATGRRGTTLALLALGSSKDFWGRIPLPFSLAFLGANGCYLRTNTLILVGLPVSNGSVSLSNQLIAVDKRLIGGTLYTQFLIADPGANSANLTTTNGIKTTVGGQR